MKIVLKQYNRDAFFLLVIIILACVVLHSTICCVEALPNQNSPLPVKFHGDQKTGVRVLCNGIEAISNIGSEFHIYKRRLDGGRENLLQGSWPSTSMSLVSSPSRDRYSLTARNEENGATCSIDYWIENGNTIRIRFDFTIPDAPGGVEYAIVDLPDHLYRGAALKSAPETGNDLQFFPQKPNDENRRFILKNKNAIVVSSSMFDMELIDMDRSRGINIADFRAVTWARTKGFHFYSNPQMIVSGGRHTGDYLIRFHAPQAERPKDLISSDSLIFKEPDYTVPFFCMPPKVEKKLSGRFLLENGTPIHSNMSHVAAILSNGIEERTGKKMGRFHMEESLSRDGIYILLDDASSDLRAEGFKMEIAPRKIIIRGTDERGCLFGVYTLLDRIGRKKSEWSISCASIRDWPELRIRAHFTEIMPTFIRDVSFFKRYLAAVSRARGNTIIFYFYPRHIKEWKTGKGNRFWSRTEMAEIVRYARTLSLDVWVGISVQLIQNQDTEFDVLSGSNFYNPDNPKSYDILYDYYNEIIETFHPSTFLIGHDEIKGLSLYALKNKKLPAEILSIDIERIHGWLKGRGIRTAIWGDMLLDSLQSEYYPANSRNPSFNSGVTHTAIDAMSKDIIIMDWHYQPRESYPSIGYFKSKGFEVIGCLWHSPVVAQKMAIDIKEKTADGIASTDWDFWNTLTPAATTLYSLVLGWSPEYAVDTKGKDVMALSDSLGIRKTCSGCNSYPYDLSDYVNSSTVDMGSGNGIFNMGPLFDLRSLPEGNITIRDTMFNIRPAKQGTSNNVIVIDPKADKPERRNLPVFTFVFNKNMAGTISILHTCFFETPNYIPRKIGRYEIVYEDGGTYETDLIEGWNIRDARSASDGSDKGWNRFRYPDILSGAKLAWRGHTDSGIPVSLNVIEIINPYPNKRLAKMNIYTVQLSQPWRIVVLGISLTK